MDLDRVEFELAVKDAVKTELDNIKGKKRFRRRKLRIPRQGRPWWFPFAVVALCVINTILWPVAFGVTVGLMVWFFFFLRWLLAP